MLCGLAVTAILGTFGAPALAAHGEVAPTPYTDIAGHQAEADLTLLAALGTFAGPGAPPTRGGTPGPAAPGPVYPDAPVTRAEFCRVAVSALGRGDAARGLSGLRPAFADEVPVWAWGYVNVAVYLGLVKGYDNGTFRADAPVSYAEAVTMLVRGVPGHAARVPPGVWPYNVMFYALDQGFTGRVDLGLPGLDCPRGDMARLVAATLEVPRLDQDGDPVPDSAVLWDRVWLDGAAWRHGNLLAGPLRAYLPDATAPQAVVDDEGRAFDLPLADPVYLLGGRSVRELLNMNVRAVLDAAGDCVYLQATEATKTYGGVFAAYHDTPGSTPGPDSYEFTDGTIIPFIPGPPSVTGTSSGGAAAEAPACSACLEAGRSRGVRLLTAAPDPSATLVQLNGHPLQNETGELLDPGDECVVYQRADGSAASVVALRYDLPVESGVAYLTRVVPSRGEDDTVVFARNADYDEDLAYELPSGVAVKVNGQPAARDGLAKWDVVRLASQGADGFYCPDCGPIHAAAATRELVEGRIIRVWTLTNTAGTTYHTTLEFPGQPSPTTRDYLTDAGGNIQPPLAAAIGTTGKFGLDADGHLYAHISYTAITNKVLVTMFETTVDGSGNPGRFVTCDLRGTPVRFAAAEGAIDPAVDVGEIGTLDLDPGSNVVRGFTPFQGDGHLYDVVALDPVGGSVTLRHHAAADDDDIDGAGGAGTLTDTGRDAAPVTIKFAANAVIYRQDADGVFAYVPLARAELWESDDGTADGYTVKLESGAGPALIEYSPRPAVARAGEVVLDTSGDTSDGPADNTFILPCQAGEFYVIDTSNLSEDGDTVILVYRPGEDTPFIGQDDAWSLDSNLGFIADQTGDYRVEILPYDADQDNDLDDGCDDSDNDGTYELEIDRVPQGGGDDRESAAELEVDGLGLYEVLGDETPYFWYRFNAEAGQTYYIYTDGGVTAEWFTGEDTDTAITIYDAEGDYIDEDTDSGMCCGSLLEYTAEADEVVYVEVALYEWWDGYDGPYDDTGPFRIRVVTGDPDEDNWGTDALEATDAKDAAQPEGEG
jgi:hypothetical protein